jgi:hypothetical protein
MEFSNMLSMRLEIFEDQKWCVYYELMVAFQRQYGHCLVPKNDERLGDWVTRQRKINMQNTLPRGRKHLLDQIGFIWDAMAFHWDGRWNQQYEKLVAFKRKHGHFNTAVMKVEDTSLVTWVGILRSRAANNNPLRQDRMDLLEKIGFRWEEAKSLHDDSIISIHGTDQKWHDQYRKLVEFQRKHGHACVPSCYKGDTTLAKWVRKQRFGLIRPDRKVLLDQLGFVWNNSYARTCSDRLRDRKANEEVRSRHDDPIRDQRWHHQYRKLVEFQRKNGHACVPSCYKEDKSLAIWVRTQRFGLRRPDRKVLLDQLGFVWDNNKGRSSSNRLANGRVMTSEEHHQEQQQVVKLKCESPKKKQRLLLSRAPQEEELSPPPSPPPAMTFPFSLSAGSEYAVTFDLGSPLGLELEPIIMGNGCRVLSIQHGSQAWQSGNIHLGDVVSKLNGQPLSDFCYEAIMYLLHRQLQQEVTFFRPDVVVKE